MTEKRREVIELEGVLEKLYQFFQAWGLSSDDWCLVGEWALVLQGLDIKGRKGILDVYVNRNSFPFKVKDERQVVPPRGSKYFDEWVKITAKTQYGLDMIPIPENPEDFRTKASITEDTTMYRLPDGSRIRINTPLAEIKVHRWLFQRYTCVDVGEENIERWWGYIKNIRQAAICKEYKEVVEACDELLTDRLAPERKI